MKTLKSVMFDFFGSRDLSGRFTSGMDFQDGELCEWNNPKVFDEFLDEIISLIVAKQLRPNDFNVEGGEVQIYYTKARYLEDEIMIVIPSSLDYIQIQRFRDSHGLIIRRKEEE